MRTRRLIMLLAVVAMMMGAMAPAWAGGVSSAKLEAAGWSCAPINGKTHCFSPAFSQGKAGNVMVFSLGDDTFLGTELLRFTSKDLSELPCNKDGGYWHKVDDGLWACHHWKGAPA